MAVHKNIGDLIKVTISLQNAGEVEQEFWIVPWFGSEMGQIQSISLGVGQTGNVQSTFTATTPGTFSVSMIAYLEEALTTKLAESTLLDEVIVKNPPIISTEFGSMDVQ